MTANLIKWFYKKLNLVLTTGLITVRIRIIKDNHVIDWHVFTLSQPNQSITIDGITVEAEIIQ